MGLEVINVLRKQAGLTNEQLAEQSGVPLGTLTKITTGITKDPKLETLKAIARVLNCSLEAFDDFTNRNQIDNIILSEEEKAIIKNYRELPHMQQAVRVLLGMELAKSGCNDDYDMT